MRYGYVYLKYKIWDELQLLRDSLQRTSIVKKSSRKRKARREDSH